MENLDAPFWFVGLMCLSGIIADVLFYKRFDNYTALAFFILILDIAFYIYLGTVKGKILSIEELKEIYPDFYERFYREYDLYCDEMCKHCDPIHSFCWLLWIDIEPYDLCYKGHKRNENGTIIYKEVE